MSERRFSEAVVFINGPWANQSRRLDRYPPGYMLKVVTQEPVPIVVEWGTKTLPQVDLGYRVGHYEMVWHQQKGGFVQRYGIWRGACN